MDVEMDEEGFAILTTDEMRELLFQGCRLELVGVSGVSEEVLSHYGEAERAVVLANEAGDTSANDIVVIEYAGEEEVQCILVDDAEHLYLTDGFISTHNTSNIVFLKSTDDSMIETLQKMSGTTHETMVDSKSVTHDLGRLFQRNEGKVTYTKQTSERPVIKYNDMAFISPRNSIVFRAGDSPIWNRNESALPMSWRLFLKKIVHPGHDYTLQTIPTQSTAIEFDVRKNIPDFDTMLQKRIAQATATEHASEVYQRVTGLSDLEMARMDPDQKASEIMAIVNRGIREQAAEMLDAGDVDPDDIDLADDAYGDEELPEDDFATPAGLEFGLSFDVRASAVTNEEQLAENRKSERAEAERSRLKFAGGRLSESDLWNMGVANHSLDRAILSAVTRNLAAFWGDSEHFSVRDGSLYSAVGNIPYIITKDESEDLRRLSRDAEDPTRRVFSEEDLTEDAGEIGRSMVVTDAFLEFLAREPDWKGFADGLFDRAMASALAADEA